MSSCRWVRLCRVMTHSEGPYLSSTRIQCLQLRAFRCAIVSLVQPFLPQLKMSSTIRVIGAHTSYSSAGRSPSNTNSDAGNASFWYSSAIEQNNAKIWFLIKFCSYTVLGSNYLKILLYTGFPSKSSRVAIFWYHTPD